MHNPQSNLNRNYEERLPNVSFNEVEVDRIIANLSGLLKDDLAEVNRLICVIKILYKKISGHLNEESQKDFYSEIFISCEEVDNYVGKVSRLTQALYPGFARSFHEILAKNIIELKDIIDENKSYDFDTLSSSLSRTKKLYTQQSIVLQNHDFSNVLENHLRDIRQLFDLHSLQNEAPNGPRCFISYAWPLLKHEKSERNVQSFLTILRKHLRLAGIQVVLDIVDNTPGKSIYSFMEQAKKSEYALLILTRSLRDKHYDPKARAVHVELDLLNKKHELDLAIFHNKVRVYPALISGEIGLSNPPGHKMYSNIIDWRSVHYVENLKNFIQWIYLDAINKESEDQSICSKRDKYIKLWDNFTASHAIHLLSEDMLRNEPSIDYHENHMEKIRSTKEYGSIGIEKNEIPDFEKVFFYHLLKYKIVVGSITFFVLVALLYVSIRINSKSSLTRLTLENKSNPGDKLCLLPYRSTYIASIIEKYDENCESKSLIFPNYISTNHEKILTNKLLAQSSKNKFHIICGIAGSGKYTLASQKLQVYKQCYNHQTHDLLAQTTNQWNASLNAWATSLGLNLTDDFSPEVRNDYLRKKLSYGSWFILIRNFAHNKQGPFMDEVKVFFNIGNVTLLVTTEECSYSYKSMSIDLSRGFLEEESDQLMSKILSPSSTTAWFPKLGSSQERYELMESYGRLPLGVSVSAYYLIRENEINEHLQTDIFTYRDYYNNLQDDSEDDINNALDESLKYNSDISRINDITKNTKVVRTLSRVIELSLSRAIYSEAPDKPNMAIWQLLCFCSFLSSNNILSVLLDDYLQKILPPKKSAKIKRDFYLIVQERYSLLLNENYISTIDNRPTLHMHKIIQKILRDKYWALLIGSDLKIIPSDVKKHLVEQELQLRYLMIMAFSERSVQAFSNTSLDAIREYLPHMQAWISYWPIVEVGGLDMLFHEIFAEYYSVLGCFNKAQSIFESILKIQDKNCKNKAARCGFDIAVTKTKLGKQYDKQGNDTIALAYYLAALEVMGHFPFISEMRACQQVVMTQVYIAQTISKWAYKDLRALQHSSSKLRRNDAKQLYEGAVSIGKECGLSNNSDEMIASYTGLAQITEQSNCEFFRESLNVRHKNTANRDSFYYVTQLKLANCLATQADANDDVTKHREAAVLYEEYLKVHGANEENIDVAHVAMNYAMVLIPLGDFIKIKSRIPRILKVIEKVNPSDASRSLLNGRLSLFAIKMEKEVSKNKRATPNSH